MDSRGNATGTNLDPTALFSHFFTTYHMLTRTAQGLIAAAAAAAAFCHLVPTYVRLPAALMSQVYEHQKDEDGFLYITYSGENTFG